MHDGIIFSDAPSFQNHICPSLLRQGPLALKPLSQHSGADCAIFELFDQKKLIDTLT
jgi:hypothetical protein